MLSCPAVPPETGGIIGGRNGVVTEYIQDRSSHRMDVGIYIPNVVFLNRCIRDWMDKGIIFMGLVHSHPLDQPELSSGDMIYISEVIKNAGEQVLYFPIVLPKYTVVPYAVSVCDGEIKRKKDLLQIYYEAN